MEIVSKNRMRFLTIIIVLLSWNLKAQDVSFVASGPGRVAQGAQFRISYTVNAQASNLKAPTFRDFNFLGAKSVYFFQYANYKRTGLTNGSV